MKMDDKLKKAISSLNQRFLSKTKAIAAIATTAPPMRAIAPKPAPSLSVSVFLF